MSIARRLVALFSALCLLPVLAFAATSTASASPAVAEDQLFKPLPRFTMKGLQDVRVRPAEFRAYQVDLDALAARLSSGGRVPVTIPDPAGTPTTFHVVEHSVMEPELQAAHPEIRTYRGADADGSTITLDVTPMGFHAFVRRPDGVTWLIDPAYNRRGEDRVLSYAGGSTETSRTFVERELERAVDSVKPAVGETDFSTPGGAVSKRTYRMAFVTEQTYADYFGSANVFAEKTTMMNRVNEVYNDDLAIEFVLVAGTDTELNLDTDAKAIEANGPCGASACFTPAELAGCGGSTLDRNNFVTGMLIGAENFDIGHIGLGVDGGGVAGLGVVGTSDKAAGCTGLATPTGDFYAIDYVAHEVGHQMGGNHTFNGANGNCAGGNRNAGTSVEPGSGSSIMAYAGICAADNLQPHSDPYFSQRSVDEIEATAAAAPSNNAETQQVAFLDLAAGEQVTLSCAACSSQTVTISGNAVADALALASAINSVTGTVAAVSGYDGAPGVSTDGFTASFAGLSDVKTLTAVPAVGSAFTAIVGTIVNGGPETNGGAVSVSANNSPTITGAADKTIPTRTPFALTAAAADANGDTLTYMWEQNDIGGASGAALQSNTKTAGPLFRQFGIAAPVTEDGTLEYHSPGENLAGTSPTRVFPDMTQVLAGNTNAATGSCPTPAPAGQTLVDCFSEFLPTSGYLGTSSSRQLNFRLSVRDEFSPDGGADDPGGLTQDDVVLTVDPLTGPFLVTSRSTAGSASGSEAVTWSVAGTNTAALAQNVRISLSTDGGLTFPTELIASTPNDGSQTVTLPNVTTSTARIKVEAVGNYFFDVNDANFSISPAANTAPVVDAGLDVAATVGAPYSSSGSFTDESPDTATATVDYGDGAGPEPLTLIGSTFNLNHTYATPGAKTVTVTVTDSGLLSGSDTATVTVSAVNVAPVVNAGPDATVTVGAPFSSSGSFTDESPSTATATVNYGDGAGPQPLTLTGSTFNLSRTYTTAGLKTVTVTVTDSGSLSGSDTATVTVNAAPPPATAHLGDGRGAFVSKKGSSKAAKQATGKARFRFTADTTGATPSGSARFKFRLGKVRFASTAVTSATVSGKTLTLVVTGTNNGMSGYTLTIVAVDGPRDKIRVRMLKGSRVRYDSMPGKPASAKPRTRLMSGNITVV